MKTAPRTSSQKKKAGLYFLISFILIVLLLIFEPQFFWVPLPFALTFAVVALDKM